MYPFPPPKKVRGPYKAANNSMEKLLRQMADPDEMQRKRERAYEEEAEKKRQREEDKKRAEEEHWIALGVAISCLSIDDFILPPDAEDSPEAVLKTLDTLTKPSLPLFYGKQVLCAVQTFCYNLKALLGPTAKNMIISDVYKFCSVLTGTSKSNLIRMKEKGFR